MQPLITLHAVRHHWRTFAPLALCVAAAGAQAQPPAGERPPLEDIARSLAELAAIEQPPPPAPAAAPPSPDLFGTVALPAPAARTAARWAAVRDAVVTSPALNQLAAHAFALVPERRIAAVQSIVNRRIAYRDDARWWGIDDYWASADQTVMRGGGDCEDIAIVKLHLLRRLGFTAEQLYLSVGRLGGKKRVRGDHAVALVRLAGGWWVLDDRFDWPIAAARFTDFSPVLTFAADSAWMHGRRAARAAGLRP